MSGPLTLLVHLASLALALLAGWYLLRGKVLDDRMLLVAAVLELLLLGQAGWTCAHAGGIHDGAERATFVSYAVTLPLIPPAVLFVALKEKTAWAMAAVVVGVVVVATMTLRLQQIWSVYA